MTTNSQRGGRSGNREDELHGAHLHLHLNTGTDHITTLPNAVLRGVFHREDGTPVTLAAGPRCALYALMSYSTALRNPDYRLRIADFAAGFRETRDTVYRWIRVLEEEGFVQRWRVNDPATGQFSWHMSATLTPAALATVTDVNPEVTPIPVNPRDGAAPPVDNLDNRRSHHPGKKPGWVNPSMEIPDVATITRETSNSYLPASPPVSDACANERETGGGGQSEEPEGQPFATTAPPRLVRWTDRTEDEKHLAADEKLVMFLATLINAPECLGKLMPPRPAQETLAIRVAVALDRGWTYDQLRRYLLADLRTADNVAGVWAYRLHPKNLPVVPGRRLAPDLASQGDTAPTDQRRAEIRSLFGVDRGPQWETRMGGETG